MRDFIALCRYRPWLREVVKTVGQVVLPLFSTSCSTCFGQPCAHHQELTTAGFYSLVSV